MSPLCRLTHVPGQWQDSYQGTWASLSQRLDVGGLSGPFSPHTLSGRYPGVLDPFRQKDKSLSLSFFVATRFKNCLVSLLDLGPSFLPRKLDPKTASGRLSLHLGLPIAGSGKILPYCIGTKSLVWQSVPFSFYSGLAKPGYNHPSYRKFPQTRTLLFVLLHNKSNRWLHPFLTGPIFWPLIMFAA